MALERLGHGSEFQLGSVGNQDVPTKPKKIETQSWYKGFYTKQIVTFSSTFTVTVNTLEPNT